MLNDKCPSDGCGGAYYLCADYEDIIKYCDYDIKTTNDIIKEINKMESNCFVKPTVNSFAIKNVIFNPPATIVFWEDGTKTVVKCENEEFDPEKGMAMAISKKMLGNKGNYFNEFKKWIEPYLEKDRMDRESISKIIESLRFDLFH